MKVYGLLVRQGWRFITSEAMLAGRIRKRCTGDKEHAVIERAPGCCQDVPGQRDIPLASAVRSRSGSWRSA